MNPSERKRGGAEFAGWTNPGGVSKHGRVSIIVLYATVSGNAEALAEFTVRRLGECGLPATAASVAEFPVARLQEFETALVIASTWGEGAPPPEAEVFFAALQARPTGRSSRLRFAVLALGSRAYPEFCGFGRRLDAALEEGGATRLLPRVDCDTKLKADFERWLADVVRVLRV